MSFLAKLQIDGQEYTVLNFSIHFHQKTNTIDRPDDIARGGRFKISIESDRKTDFLNWMLSNSVTKDGTVIFYRRDAMSKMKELQFTKGFCIDFKEDFDSSSTSPMITQLEITAKTLDFSGAKYSKDWDLDT